MADNIIIPVSLDAYQEFSYTLENIEWFFTFAWNFTDNARYMDLDQVSLDISLKGLKLVGGRDILEPHAISELGEMYVVDYSGQDLDPDFNNWGNRFKLLYVPIENGSLL